MLLVCTLVVKMKKVNCLFAFKEDGVRFVYPVCYYLAQDLKLLNSLQIPLRKDLKLPFQFLISLLANVNAYGDVAH